MNATHATDARIYSRAEAAAILGVKISTMAHWAMQGRGPAYARSGSYRGRVWYRAADLDRWLQSRSVTPSR
jgi:transposase